MQFDYHTRIKPIPAYNEQNCIRISSNGDTSPEALDNIGFGLAEAKKRCDGFFEAIGLAGEYGLGYSFLVDDTGMDIQRGRQEAGGTGGKLRIQAILYPGSSMA